MSVVQAPTGDSREFLPFCAAQCIGAIGAASRQWWLSALDRLRSLCHDPRQWVRRGVVLGLRRMLQADFLPTADELVTWIEGGRLEEMNAVAQALSEPLLLTQDINASAALALHRALIDTYLLLPLTWRDRPECRTLRQTLASSLSVVVAAAPEEGFEDMRRWAAQADPDLKWILVQNLTQARLADVYQVQTEWVLQQLKRLP